MFVRRAIDHYLKGKRSRRDVTRFLETHPDLDRLAERIADEIREGRYRDTRITYFNRVEPISGKHRVIGRESVRHQIYDHVAVMALQPLFDAKVGRWQTASIPNRGTIDARRAIKRWTRERSSKWFVKLDVRKYYPSIDRPTLKAMLTRDVGDPILLRLVFHLIDRYQGDNGLNIGSYLSQWLANYYLSHAYHWIESPAMTIERTSRRTGEITRRRLITHQLWYMDDLLLIGTSKRDLKIAARRIVRYLKDALKLDVHEEWNCKRLDLEPIDMVGYTFRPHGRQHPQRRVPPRPPHLQPRQTPAHDRTARATLLLLLRIPAQQRQHPIPATPPHRPHHAPRNPVFIHPTQEGKPMLQTVSSLEPLEEVSYYPRGDGLADIRIRRNITTVMHGDGETAWTEYTADEAYTIRDLTEQEAIEQADSIWLDCVQASKSDSQRLAGLEASSLDQDEALAEIYQLLSGGEA